MDLKTCYENMNADYNDVMLRLRNENLVQKVLILFLEDNSFSTLESALTQGDFETAFRAVHTLKGIALNLSLTTLIKPAVALTDALRGGEPKDGWMDMYDELKIAYLSVRTEIEEYKRSL